MQVRILELACIDVRIRMDHVGVACHSLFCGGLLMSIIFFIEYICSYDVDGDMNYVWS